MNSKNILHESWAVLRVVIARLRFVMVFLVAALVVGYWDNLKNYADKWTRPAIAPDALASAAIADIEFYCSMHPNVIRMESGSCPICGMPLTKRKKGEALRLPADVLARVQLTPQRVALANVHTSVVESKELVYDVSSVGVLDYNETKLARISARVAGRADKLFVNSIGQQVKQGDPLYSLYSPEVFTALREYLSAQKRVSSLPTDAGVDAKSDASAVMDASRQRMLLWGVTEPQLAELAAAYQKDGKVASDIMITSPITGIVVAKNLYEGGYVQTGDNVFTVADLSTLWLQAKLYERDVPLVNIGDSANVVVDAMPNGVFAGKVTFKAFQIDPQTRTLDARVEVGNPDLKLRPGMFASATMRIPVAKTVELSATTRPSTDVDPAQVSMAYSEAFDSYLKAQKLLSEDKVDDVANLLAVVVTGLKPVAANAAVSSEFDRLADTAAAMKGRSIEDVRNSFKQFSSSMLAIGKAVGIADGKPETKVYRCSMVNAPWIQLAGSKANPYMGSMMLTCGDEQAPLPAMSSVMTEPTLRPAAGRVLAVPRSAVIDTGKRKIVYVASSEGVYDMHEVKLGPVAGEFYPVLEGLQEGQSVVTVGAFLIDAENRLNPSSVTGDTDHHEPVAPMGGMKM